jgi:hypothetical protein
MSFKLQKIRIPMRLGLQLYLLSFILLPASSSCFSQAIAKALPLHSAVQDKDFYLLSLLQSDPQVRRILTTSIVLKGIGTERERSLASSSRLCKGDAVCNLKALLWTDEEIGGVSLALRGIYQSNEPLRSLVDSKLRSSGTYVLYEKENGANLLVSAWEICARGLNDVISVYGQGSTPRYPQIDSISLDLHSADAQQSIASLVNRVSAKGSSEKLFFESSLESALELLNMNHRDEAGRLEPMETGVNEAAVKAIPSIQWKNYGYSVIVVPGAGPSDSETALSVAGRRRTELAAEAYHAGKAPFILVSGGYVHPSQTRFSEAVEMKRALLSNYHVPEAAILVDPHARHTTTNMRNAAREIYRYNMPMDKPALVISDTAQVGYIAGQDFADRCMKELGYLPYQIISRPSETSLVFLPLKESLEQDPMDPLDP